VEANWLGRKTGRGFYQYPLAVSTNSIQLELEVKEEIFDRVVYMLINEAADTLFLKIASRDDIDTAMKFGVNYPKGLFEWADELGIQNCVDYLDQLKKKFGDDRYRCSPLLRDMAANGNKFY
jgi:3-hydroxybutyryl-CoA dehydrogenase